MRRKVYACNVFSIQLEIAHSASTTSNVFCSATGAGQHWWNWKSNVKAVHQKSDCCDKWMNDVEWCSSSSPSVFRICVVVDRCGAVLCTQSAYWMSLFYKHTKHSLFLLFVSDLVKRICVWQLLEHFYCLQPIHGDCCIALVFQKPTSNVSTKVVWVIGLTACTEVLCVSSDSRWRFDVQVDLNGTY